MATARKKEESTTLIVQKARITEMELTIVGTAPFVMNAFSKKAADQMKLAMTTPKNQKKSKDARPPRDFDDDYVQCQHRSTEGWHGFPAAAFRAAMIDACRAANIVMTRAKMSVWVVADGVDAVSGAPLVRLTGGTPERLESLVRNDNGGADIRIRAMWKHWGAKIRLRFDEDMITSDSVVNLLARAGLQVGIGEGRPYSKNSVGQGWGTFDVVEQYAEDAEKKVA